MNTVNVTPFTTTIPKLESVTDKYRFIPTGKFIEDVKANGYTLLRTFQPRRGLGMHGMVFSHPSLPKLPGFEMRLLATNAHDGTAAFRLFLQVYVQVCSNGLVAWSNATGARVIHVGYAADKVKAALTEANNHVGKTLATVKALQENEAKPEQTAAFLLGAQQLRDAIPFRLTDLTDVRHSEQSVNSAWNVFNRVQEAIIRGGYTTQGQVINGVTYRGQRAREITAVREQVKINQSLWKLAIESFLSS